MDVGLRVDLVNLGEPLVEPVSGIRLPMAITTFGSAWILRIAAIWASLFAPFHSFSINPTRRTSSVLL